MDFRYYGIAELALVVSDIRRSKAFYVDILGFEELPVDVGPRACILKIGERRYLGLWEPGAWSSDYLPPHVARRYYGEQVSPAHPVFAVHQEDVPAIARRLEEAGYQTWGPMPHGDGSLHLYVSDPDGHALEFWGWRPGRELA